MALQCPHSNPRACEYVPLNDTEKFADGVKLTFHDGEIILDYHSEPSVMTGTLRGGRVRVGDVMKAAEGYSQRFADAVLLAMKMERRKHQEPRNVVGSL